METFTSQNGAVIVDNMIAVIQQNKQYLSDIDGLIGDGDHGINMNKGFTMCSMELKENPGDITHSMKTLARILLMEIGGSMGPLYGKFFKEFALSIEGKNEIGKEEFRAALEAVLKGIQSMSPARKGDKTLMDTLVPAVEAYRKALASGKTFADSLDEMIVAAEAGKDATKDMTARIGRASRLGERSRGVHDAGAVSCFLILKSMTETIKELIVCKKNH